MRFISILLFIFFLPAVACKTRQYTWTTESEYYNLPIWKKRVKAFKKIQMNKGVAKLFIGDSITEGFDLTQHFDSEYLLNMGIGGDFTKGVLARLDVVAHIEPQSIFLMIGINDILKQVPMDRITEQYFEILKRLKEENPTSKIFVQSVLPTVNIQSQDLSNDLILEQVRYLNTSIKSFCKALEIEFIDLYPAFISDRNELRPELTYDGLHLNNDGYIIWANIIRDKVLH